MYKLSKNQLNGLLLNATRDNNILTVRRLLQSGAYVNALDYNGNTALMIAASQSNIDNKCMELLLKKGADINMQNAQNETALMKCVDCDNKAGVDMLLYNNADPNKCDRNGNTAFLRAIELSRLHIAEVLSSFIPDLSYKNHFDEDALMLAYQSKNIKVILFVLKLKELKEEKGEFIRKK